MQIGTVARKRHITFMPHWFQHYKYLWHIFVYVFISKITSLLLLVCTSKSNNNFLLPIERIGLECQRNWRQQKRFHLLHYFCNFYSWKVSHMFSRITTLLFIYLFFGADKWQNHVRSIIDIISTKHKNKGSLFMCPCWLFSLHIVIWRANVLPSFLVRLKLKGSFCWDQWFNMV